MVSALQRKLIRDLSRMRGQVITIALVIACGIASYTTTAGSYASLLVARDDYYASQRFPDVFASLKRAPRSLLDRIGEIPGVFRHQDRVVQYVSLPMSGLTEPALGKVISLPSGQEPTLASVDLRDGRAILPRSGNEVLVIESFAEAHGLTIGDSIPVVINGKLRDLKVVGIALSPEALFAMAPGEFVPDPKRSAVLWMDRDALANAYDMDGAFNNLLVDLDTGASEPAVLEAMDQLLSPYGGGGAFGRSRHPSHSMLVGELSQLQSMSTVMPFIFLGVAAFLVNLVLGRVIQLQRPQIATLKAVGYSNWAVGMHFFSFVLLIVVLGTILGVLGGHYLGQAMIELYQRYFHFPNLAFDINAPMVTQAVLISLGAGVIGALNAVWSVVRLPPAEAMQPEPPATYRRSASELLHKWLRLGQSTTMVLREIERRPLRTLLSAAGIACAVALLVIGRFSFDAIDAYMETSFYRAQRQDITVIFAQPQPRAAVKELAHLPGVLAAEGQRTVSARVTSGHHHRNIRLIGHSPESDLQPFVNGDGHILAPPSEGIVLTDILADILDVAPGDSVDIAILEGQRRQWSVPVAGTVSELFGISGHLSSQQLDRLASEGALISAAYLRVDPTATDTLIATLKDRPAVLGVTQRDHIIKRFNEQTAGQMQVTTWIMTLFAVVIAAGVIYNNARVALSTRSRDLASLRVLGFRRSEISSVLLLELSVQLFAGLVPGMLLGTLLAQRMLAMADPEQYRFPVVISLQTYVFSAVVTLLAAALAALLVRRKLDHLDLISVLKTRG